MEWVIFNKVDAEYCWWWATEFWSNEFGWCGLLTATIFTDEEKNTLNLPIDGEWIEYSKALTIDTGDVE